MNREFVGVSESDRLVDAAELMAAEPTEAVVVVRGSELIGTLSTERALSAMVDGAPEDRSVGEVMEPAVPTISPDAAVTEATQQLVSRRSTHLVVVDDGEIVGLLTQGDVLATQGAVETTAAAPAGGSEAGDVGEAIEADGDSERSVQGICEECGSLSPELSTVNGQLVCPDCRAY